MNSLYIQELETKVKQLQCDYQIGLEQIHIYKQKTLLLSKQNARLQDTSLSEQQQNQKLIQDIHQIRSQFVQIRDLNDH